MVHIPLLLGVDNRESILCQLTTINIHGSRVANLYTEVELKAGTSRRVD